jgi:8-oxo-dGTP pyrophosphatase MutT (NUDIX family)
MLPPGPTPAAVLLPLTVTADGIQLLVTRRAPHLNHHGGEFAFPGGVRHPEDPDLLATALRETWEEVGINPADVDILGTLDDTCSIHGYLVTPFVGVFPDHYSLKFNPQEIDKSIYVPLHHLADLSHFRTEDWTWQGRQYPVHFFTYGDDEIWGMTAGILKQFLDLIFPDWQQSPR